MATLCVWRAGGKSGDDEGRAWQMGGVVVNEEAVLLVVVSSLEAEALPGGRGLVWGGPVWRSVVKHELARALTFVPYAEREKGREPKRRLQEAFCERTGWKQAADSVKSSRVESSREERGRQAQGFFPLPWSPYEIPFFFFFFFFFGKRWPFFFSFFLSLSLSLSLSLFFFFFPSCIIVIVCCYCFGGSRLDFSPRLVLVLLFLVLCSESGRSSARQR